jgi:hypothetical protein
MQSRGVLLTLCSAFFIALVCAGDNSKQTKQISLEELKSAMERKYPVEEKPDGPRLHFDPRANIEALNYPILQKYLPKTRFFLTILNTDYHEYRQVWTVISASASHDKISIHECFHMTFTNVPKDFLAQFTGLRAKTLADRKDLALAIGELLGKPNGQPENGHFEKADYWMEIGNWRYVVIRFDVMGNLKKVDVIHPAELNKPDQ